MKNKTLYRELVIPQNIREAIDEENRQVTLSFSSEKPVLREFGLEILDHKAESIDLTRFEEAGNLPLLLNHNSDEVVGVVEGISLDSERCSAVCRFGRSARAEEVFKDVQDGIRTNVSFGYRILEMVKVENEKEPTYRVTSWQPYEVSLVALPADTTVGVGRSDRVEEEDLNPADDSELSDSGTTEETKVTDETVENTTGDTEHTVVVKENRKMDPKELQNERTSAAQAERSRITGIEAVADKVRHLLPEVDAMARDFKNSDKTVADFHIAIVAQMNNIERKVISNTTDLKSVGMDARDVQKYSIMRAINAMATGNWKDAGYERELSQAVESAVGQSARGLFVPYEVLTRVDLSAQQSDSVGAGSLIGTDHMASLFVDRLRDRSVLLQAGAQMLPGLVGDVDIPRLTAGAAYSWIDNESFTGETETEVTLDKIELSPHTLRGRVGLTRKMLQQSSPAVDAIVRNDMLIGIAQEFDKTGLVGVTGASQPHGVRWDTAVNSFAVVPGTGLTWSSVVSAETLVNAANADLGSLAYITNSKVLGSMKTIIKDSSGAGGYIYENGLVNGYPAFVTNSIPSTFLSGNTTVNSNTGGDLSPLFFGAWDQMLMGMWGGIDLELDKITLGDRGALILRIFLDGDVKLRNPKSFSYLGNIKA